MRPERAAAKRRDHPDTEVLSLLTLSLVLRLEKQESPQVKLVPKCVECNVAPTCVSLTTRFWREVCFM